jgi:hypothetical protein
MEILGQIFTFIILLVIIAILLALPTMWLWNWLMPEIFGLVKIGFWKALGLNLFTGILFRNSNTNKNE